jgi:hypothetical protein
MAINDHNLKLTEQQYRDLELPSYSMLSSIEQHGVDVIKGDKMNLNLKFGSLVDVMCFEPHRVKDLFYKGNAVKVPTSTHKKVVDGVIDSVLNSSKKKPSSGIGELKRKIGKTSSSLKDYKQKVINGCIANKVLTSLSDDVKFDRIFASSQDYFKDKIQSSGKMLIKPEMWALALEVVKTLETHFFTAKYFAKNVKDIEIIYQYKFDTKVNGRRCKGMLDCLIINHALKLVIPVDLKTGEIPAKNFPQSYTGYRYYIQGALYREALKTIISEDFELMEYTVQPFEFVYISKLNPFKPLVFIVDDEMHQAALDGFTDIHGYNFRGVHSLLEDYYGCVEDGFCNYIEEELQVKGRIVIDKKSICR